jgi:predicted nucleotidyltransferase
MADPEYTKAQRDRPVELEPSVTDYTPYVEGWRQRIAARKEALRRQAVQARAAAARAADLLVDRYGVRRVLLFGSLARGEFREESDIDLAVEGLAKGAYLEALVEVGRLTDTPVELKLLEECRGFFLERILREGLVLRDAERETSHDSGGDR